MLSRARIAALFLLPGLPAVGSAAAVTHHVIPVPPSFLATGPDGPFGGDVRIGDLDGDRRVDFLVYRSVEDAHDGGGLKPCFLGAFDIHGRELWHAGGGGEQPSRPGPVIVHDIDVDGRAEVVCFFHDSDVSCPPESMADVVVQIREGATGKVLREARIPEIAASSGNGANWVHQRLLAADLRGQGHPGDFVVKLGTRVIAFSDALQTLWVYESPWSEYSRCPAYIPAVGDIDGDGRDEVNGGYSLIDNDGTVLWEKRLARNMDSVAIAPWDGDRMRAICSGGGHVVDQKGNTILALGEDIVPHGQELRLGRFDPTVPGMQMMIRYRGHKTDVMLVAEDGEIVRRFRLNESPNNTGMETVFWNGPDAAPLLYNGGLLWNGRGEVAVTLPNLPAAKGDSRQGWYHCIPADLFGDEREEVILYNPWDDRIHIFGPQEGDLDSAAKFRAGPRQYNARLMD